MPPAPENQEKIVALQEKLQALQQHETNDQCNGGPQCILQTPMFTAAVVDSPQVSEHMIESFTFIEKYFS